MNVTPIDWLIVITLFAALLAMAVWINGQCKSVADYLISGRKVRLWLGLGAGIAGEVGLVTIVSICEQGYMRGFGFILIGLLIMLVTVPLLGIFGFGIERFRATRAMSVPQYLEMRYGRKLRILTGILNSLAGVLQMSIFPIVGAQFLRILMDAPEFFYLGSLMVPTTWIVMLVLLSCAVIFTYLGGYVTLIVTNFFQMIVIMVAIYWLFFYLVGDIGLQRLWTNLEETKGLSGFYPFAEDGDSYGFTWFAWLLTMTILLQFSYGPYLQKMASMDRPKTVSRAYLLGTVFSNGRTFVILGLGVCALAVLGEVPPEGLVTSPEMWNQIATPYYLATVTPPVLMGLLLVGLLFADISTTDQYLLSWATSIVNDCIVPFRKEPFDTPAHIRAVRLTIISLCLIFFVFGVFYKPTLPLWEYLWLCSNIIGGTGIAVIFGMYWKRASTAGAYAAVLASLIFPLTDLVARQIHSASGSSEPFPISPQTTGFGAYVASAILLIVVSLLSRKPTRYWDLGSEVRELNQKTLSR